MRYMTMEESMFANAEKHRLRGEEYLAAGNYEFAEGSFIKSFKKLCRAREMREFMSDRWIDGWIDRNRHLIK